MLGITEPRNSGASQVSRTSAAVSGLTCPAVMQDRKKKSSYMRLA